jgi:hypothetical protein
MNRTNAYRVPIAFTASLSFASSAGSLEEDVSTEVGGRTLDAPDQLPFFTFSDILLHLLRQSLFILPGNFDAILFQSLTDPAATTVYFSAPPFQNDKRARVF